MQRPIHLTSATNLPGKSVLLRILTLLILVAYLLSGHIVAAQQPAPDLKTERQQFQAQELIPNRFGGWIFQTGSTPHIIWRDVDEVRRLGREVVLRVRWFDASLNEATEPNAAGRWMAYVEGTAPNGTPFRRSMTFFALPQKIENGFVPDLSVVFPNFPGRNSPPAWAEHQAEFDRTSRELLTRGLIDSEKGASLIAGIAESKPLGRPKRFAESTSVANDACHLALKLKVLSLADKVRPLQPARARTIPAVVLHEGTPEEAGVAADAKAKIDEFCRAWVAGTDEPFVTLIARRGVIITHEAFGRDDHGDLIDRDYRCWVASITKTVTALMFSQFVDQQLIDLDAPISTIFPDYVGFDPHVPTFRQCLNHTSGLSGHAENGGMRNPHLENVVLNGIDVNEPGKAHVYSGLGFELVAKAMEIVSGKCAVRVYDEHLFQPLGFGDVVLGNASSDGEFTARELAVLGQLMANSGSYGEREFISPAIFEKLLPPPQPAAGIDGNQGLGMHWIIHRKPGTALDSLRPEDLLFGPRTVGHGSFSGCILVVDLDQQLVIAQARREFKPEDADWYAKFFQNIAETIVKVDPEH